MPWQHEGASSPEKHAQPAPEVQGLGSMHSLVQDLLDTMSEGEGAAPAKQLIADIMADTVTSGPQLDQPEQQQDVVRCVKVG